MEHTISRTTCYWLDTHTSFSSHLGSITSTQRLMHSKTSQPVHPNNIIPLTKASTVISVVISPAVVQSWMIRPESGRAVSSRAQGVPRAWNSSSHGEGEAGAQPQSPGSGQEPTHPDCTPRKLWTTVANPVLFCFVFFWILYCNTESPRWPQVRPNSVSYPPTKLLTHCQPLSYHLISIKVNSPLFRIYLSKYVNNAYHPSASRTPNA